MITKKNLLTSYSELSIGVGVGFGIGIVFPRVSHMVLMNHPFDSDSDSDPDSACVLLWFNGNNNVKLYKNLPLQGGGSCRASFV